MLARVVCGMVVVFPVLMAVQVWAGEAGGPLEVNGILGEKATLAPIRQVFTFLGYELTWVDATQTVRLENEAGLLSVTMGSREASYLDKATGEIRRGILDEAPRTVDSVGMGPLTSMWRLAGVPFTVVQAPPPRAIFDLGGRRIIVDVSQGEGQAAGVVATPSGQEMPQITMVNRSRKRITVYLWRGNHEHVWSLRPHTTIGPRSIRPGTYRYRATAPGVTSTSGSVSIEPYHDYKWTWYITTRP